MTGGRLASVGMIDLRVLGFRSAVRLQYLRRLNKLAFAGLMLFVADAVSHFEDAGFRIDLLGIAREVAKPD